MSLPVSIDIEIITHDPASIEAVALTRGAEIFDVDESDVEVTYLSDGKAVNIDQSMWRFVATVTHTPKEPF